MIRKVAYGSLALAAVGTFIFGDDAWSYLTCGAQSVRDAVRDEVPLDFEIERARQEVDDLVPEIRKSMHLIAKERVQVTQLEEQIARRDAELEEQEEAILALSADLKSGDANFVYAGRSYSVGQVERDLAERFNRFQVAEAAVKADRDTLDARRMALQAHNEALDNMMSQRRDLEVEIERLEARLRTIEARRTVSDIAIDDSHLARCKTLIAEIDSKLDVEEEILDADANFVGLIPVEEESIPVNTTGIADRVQEYFGLVESDNLAAQAE